MKVMPDLGLDALELDLHLLAQLQIERAERLVEEEDARVVDQRPREGDALLLPAGELARLAPLVAGQLDELEHLAHALRLTSASADLPPAQAEGDVLEDVQMREEGVVLEDGVDVALERAGVPVTSARRGGSCPAVGMLEAADHAQRRRLAAARRAEHREELAALDLERQVVDRGDVVEALGDALEADVAF